MPWNPGQSSTASPTTRLLGVWNAHKRGLHWRVLDPPPRRRVPLPVREEEIRRDAEAAARNQQRRSDRGRL